MKHLIIIFFISLVFLSCSKSKNTNALVGKWLRLRVIEQYTNPYTQIDEYDTLAGVSVSDEFRIDGSFFTNGTQSGTYSMLNDKSFALKPIGNISTDIYSTYSIIKVGNGMLKIRREGGNGEQKQVFNPDMQGMSIYTKILYVFTEYQKQ